MCDSPGREAIHTGYQRAGCELLALWLEAQDVLRDTISITGQNYAYGKRTGISSMSYSFFEQSIQNGMICRALANRADRRLGHEISFSVDPKTRTRYWVVKGVMTTAGRVDVSGTISERQRTEAPDIYHARLEAEAMADWDAQVPKRLPKKPPTTSPELTPAAYAALLAERQAAFEASHNDSQKSEGRIPSEVREGTEPVQARPVKRNGRKAIGAG